METSWPDSAEVRAEPVGEFMLAELTCGQREHGIDRIGLFERNRGAVQTQEQPRQNPSGALIPVSERMVAGNPERVCGCQRTAIILAVGPLIDRTAQRRFKRARIAHPAWAAMLGQLAVMNRQGKRGIKPHRFNSVSHLLGQFAQNIAVFPHDRLSRVHLRGKVRIVRR